MAVSMSVLRRLSVQKPQDPIPGEPAGLFLIPATNVDAVKPEGAMLTLSRCGLTLAEAKSVIDVLVAVGEVSVYIPRASKELTSKLAAVGVKAKRVVQ